MHKTRGKHERCPRCGSLMKRLYIKKHVERKSRIIPFAWLCLFCGVVYEEGRKKSRRVKEIEKAS